MQLTQESYRTRWLVLVLVWSVVGAVLWQQARLVDQYLNIAGGLGTRTPATVTPLRQIYPAFAADAQMWVRHALSLTEGNGPQLRFTNIDNAPDGREVHWNSAWAWCIAGAGWVHHLFTGLPLPAATERATLWLNPLTMFICVALFSAWVTRRAGVVAGVVVAVAMTCHDRMLEGFFPSYVDHHGLLAVTVFGLVLGAVFMGGGWWQERPPGTMGTLPDSPTSARSAAVFSAFSGACGMWVSAASVIPPIAIVATSGLLAIFAHGRHSRRIGASFDADSWRLWGRTGAGLSIFFYLVEYFPKHLGLRLEPNHPLHALAWLGAGELVAEIGARWVGEPEKRWSNWPRLAWPFALICLAPVVVLLGGSKVFIVFDPFMSHLHNDYIQEFLPMWSTLRIFDAKGVFQVLVVGSVPLIAAIATLTYRRRDTPIVLWFVTFAAILLTAMAWWQSRWLLNVTGSLISLLLVVYACWTAHSRPLIRWVVAITATLVLFIPGMVARFQGSVADVRGRRVAPKDALNALNRDIAAALRATQPEGDITLLTSPNSSVGIGYYGRFKTLGTLYWENSAGLKAAASILGARNEQEAAKLIQLHQVTHIAIVSDENFVAQYFRLIHPEGTLAESRQCFGLQLIQDKKIPPWLQMIAYKVPDDLRALNVGVMLFKVNFNQSVPEAIYNLVQWQIVNDAIEDADRNLDVLTSQFPQIYQPWLRKAELLLARHDWAPALDYMLKGIALAPPQDRPALYTNAAGAFYHQKQYALAIRIYRTALADKFVPELACYLSWILATTVDDSLRNGAEALQLADDALKTDPNSPTFLSVKAAALAELGRFPEAVATGDRAVVNAGLRREPAERIFAERLEIVKSGKPIRN